MSNLKFIYGICVELYMWIIYGIYKFIYIYESDQRIKSILKNYKMKIINVFLIICIYIHIHIQTALEIIFYKLSPTMVGQQQK